MNESSKLELTSREVEILFKLLFEPETEEVAAPVELLLAPAAGTGASYFKGL